MIRYCIYVFFIISPMWVQAGPYVGTFVGYIDHTEQGYDADSFELSSGYRFSEYLATEFSWLESEDTNHRNARRNNNYSRIEGTSISMLLFVPMARDIEFFGRFGTYRWITRDSVTLSSRYRAKAQHNALIGAGLIWHLSETFALRSQYQEIGVQGDNLSNLSAGLTYSF